MSRHFLYVSILLNCSLIANPTGPSVIEGGATFTGLGTGSLVVNSTSDVTAIDWTQFSIGNGEMVTFQRSGAISDYYILNCVPSGPQSVINGTLMTTGNFSGHIYLVNPAGITIGATGQVIAGAFLASTLDLSGTFNPYEEMEFQGSSQNAVTNLGSVQALNSDVTFIGYRIVNSGEITACDTVAFGAGVDIILQPTQSDRIFIQASGSPGVGTGILSSGTITSESVVFKADGNPYELAINHSGEIQITACSNSEGEVKIVAERLGVCKGAIEVSGTIQRSVATGSGSLITIDGERISLIGATLDSSGAIGAGLITVGNLDQTCPTAHIYIDGDTNILANVTGSGTGGTINILADQSLLLLGNIYATGIASGGAVNLISNNYLGVVGNINASGLNANGTVTLYSDIDVGGPPNGNAGSHFSPPNFIMGGVNANITTQAVEFALENGNVSINALGAPTESDIVIVDDFTWDSGSTLTLTAFGTIQVNRLATMTGSVLPSTQVLVLDAPIINIGKNGALSTVPTGFDLTTGSISVITEQALSLYGGKIDGSFAKLNTSSGTQTINFYDQLALLAGSANGANAEIKASSVIINGISGGGGLIYVTASNCSKAFIDAGTISIGQTIQPSVLAINGGCCSSQNEAYVGSLTAGSSISINLTGDLSLIAGSSGSSNKASIISSGGTSKAIGITCKDLTLLGGNSGTGNQAQIASLGNLGSVTITTAKDIIVTGGTSVLGSAFITSTNTRFTAGRDIIITGGNANLSAAYVEGTKGVIGEVTRFLILQGGSAPLAFADIKVTTGNITIDALTNEAQFILRGGNIVGANNASAKFLISNNGTINVGATNPPNYVNLIGGSGGEDPFAQFIIKGNGDINIETLSDITYLGGIDGTLTHASAEVLGNGSITHIAGRDMNLTTGNNSPSNAYLHATNGVITVQTTRDFNMTGNCYIPNIAYLQADGDDSAIIVSVGRDLTQRGDTRITVNNPLVTVPSSVLVISVGHRWTHFDCPVVRYGSTYILPEAPAPVPPQVFVYPADFYYKYTFLYELFYRMNYFKCYDWFVFHSNSFWDSAMYTDPGNLNHLN
jgi:filamentous hemagglutinin family protein